MSERFQQIIDENKKRTPQGPVNIRESIARVQDKKSQRGAIPYTKNAVNGINRGMTQVMELPYNIINRAPQLVNLLPGEQGMGTLDEMAAAAPPGIIKDVTTTLFPSKDPLINFMGKHYPGMDDVGGISQPNPAYPITNRVTEDIGTGVATLGAGNLASGAKGVGGVFARYLGQPLSTAPKTAIAGETLASLGAEGGRQIAEEYNVGPVGTFMLETVGSMTPSGMLDAGMSGVNRSLRREGSQASLEAMDRLGMRPSIGMTGNRMGAQLESGASSLPFFSAIPEGVRDNQFDVFTDRLRGAADTYRPAGAISKADPFQLGEQVRTIAQEGSDRLRTGFGKAEDALEQAIGPDTLIDISSTRQSIADQIPRSSAEIQQALQKELDLLDEIADPNTGMVSYAQLRSHRTGVGNRTGQPSIKGGAQKQIYAGMTDDLQRAADNAGVGQDFRDLMSNQKAAHDKSTGDIPKLEGIADNKNQIESGLNYLNAAVKNPEKMAVLKQNATPEQWQQMTGDVLEHLGMATSGNQNAAGDIISPNKFLSNWSDMDDRVKNMLFDDNLGTRQTLDDLALVAEDFKRRGLEANTSRTAGTGQAAQAITAGGALVGTAVDPVTTVGGLTLTYATVKGLMSETLARWAANQRVPLQDKLITKGMTGAAKAASTTEQERPITPVIIPQ